ncbi:MAG TPA: CHAP domain-containing protein, partial [Miltoncostaeaceae bacterium]|nr:CHAP domain-containing protein [Miltoncostaeaceae bacterium]
VAATASGGGTAAAFAQQLAQAQTTGGPGGATALALPSAAGGALPGATGSTGPVYGTVNGVPVVITPLATAPAAPSAAVAAMPGAGAGPVGQRLVAIAEAELGVREQPPGSNDGPRIAEYRTATRGAGVGPWCSYFVSWVGAQAGVPIGPGGRGEGWVPNVERWGRDTGRWIPSEAATPAQPGDVIVFDRNRDGLTDHIGIVTRVRADGGVETVEGNSSDAVSRRSYDRGEWAGLVRMAAPGA